MKMLRKKVEGFVEGWCGWGLGEAEVHDGAGVGGSCSGGVGALGPDAAAADGVVVVEFDNVAAEDEAETMPGVRVDILAGAVGGGIGEGFVGAEEGFEGVGVHAGAGVGD